MTIVQSVDRAMTLLLEVAHQPATLAELARRVDLPSSTAARLLATLEQSGAVDRSAAGLYRVGPSMVTIASGADPVHNLGSLAQPHLAELAAELGETAGLSIPAGRHVLHIAQVAAPNPVQVRDWTGTRVPMHAGCAGLAILATWPDTDVDAFLQGDLPRCTTATITDSDAIRRRLEDIRGTGSIWSEGEFVEEVTSVAAAIRHPTGRAVGALHAHGPSYRFPPAGGADAIAALVRDRAARVSALLGWRVGS